ncbi:MAG: TonB family protein [Candidatus Adiutrix sp.]|jgi:TonB family protein|nr:TonB family protein [Candidatus Adiutrix sp.]
MSAIRCRLLNDEREPADFQRDLGLVSLCLLLSVFSHLLFFSIWQTLDQTAESLFYFELASEAPPLELELELTLNMDEAGLQLTAPDEGPEAPAAGELPAPSPADPEVNPDPPISVENEAPAHKSYYTAIRMAVNSRWLIPPAAQSQSRPGRLTVDFTIGRQGALLRWVVIESTGNAVLDHAGQEAIRSAAPFPPFPEALSKFSQLDIRMNFDYIAKVVPGRPAGR